MAALRSSGAVFKTFYRSISVGWVGNAAQFLKCERILKEFFKISGA